MARSVDNDDDARWLGQRLHGSFGSPVDVDPRLPGWLLLVIGAGSVELSITQRPISVNNGVNWPFFQEVGMSSADQREEVQRILQSAQFRRAPKLQRFLELVCDYHFQGRSAEINEWLEVRSFAECLRGTRAASTLASIGVDDPRRYCAGLFGCVSRGRP
jgi:hypothetical protein